MCGVLICGASRLQPASQPHAASKQASRMQCAAVQALEMSVVQETVCGVCALLHRFSQESQLSAAAWLLAFVWSLWWAAKHAFRMFEAQETLRVMRWRAQLHSFAGTGSPALQPLHDGCLRCFGSMAGVSGRMFAGKGSTVLHNDRLRLLCEDTLCVRWLAALPLQEQLDTRCTMVACVAWGIAHAGWGIACCLSALLAVVGHGLV